MNVRAMAPTSIPSGPARPGAALTGEGAAPMSGAEAAVLARTLAALADPVRIQLVSIVAARGAVCSCDLETPLAKSQPTISHHTTILARAGILVGEKRGRWTWWRVAPDAMRDLRRALGGDYGDPPDDASSTC